MRTDAINKGSASGDVAIGGLPFSAVANTSGTANGQASISISNASGWMRRKSISWFNNSNNNTYTAFTLITMLILTILQ